eukprot:SAG22_NODE_7714_length_715_cov_1.129870_1_plen_35_part_10
MLHPGRHKIFTLQATCRNGLDTTTTSKFFATAMGD